MTSVMLKQSSIFRNVIEGKARYQLFTYNIGKDVNSESPSPLSNISAFSLVPGLQLCTLLTFVQQVLKCANRQFCLQVFFLLFPLPGRSFPHSLLCLNAATPNLKYFFLFFYFLKLVVISNYIIVLLLLFCSRL